MKKITEEALQTIGRVIGALALIAVLLGVALFAATARADERPMAEEFRDPSCQPCAGDLNGDCKVDSFDLSWVIDCFGDPGAPPCFSPDINGDGVVDAADLVIVVSNFGKPCPQQEDEW